MTLGSRHNCDRRRAYRTNIRKPTDCGLADEIVALVRAMQYAYAGLGDGQNDVDGVLKVHGWEYMAVNTHEQHVRVQFDTTSHRSCEHMCAQSPQAQRVHIVIREAQCIECACVCVCVSTDLPACLLVVMCKSAPRDTLRSCWGNFQK